MAATCYESTDGNCMFLLEISEAVVIEMKSCYEEEEAEVDKKDLASLLEEILKFAVLTFDYENNDNQEQVLLVLRNLTLSIYKEIETSKAAALLGGRKIDVQEDQLQYLIEHGFRINEISNLFACYRKTIERG